MKARADALAAEQAQRRAQPVVDTRQLGGSSLITPVFQPGQDNRLLGGAGLTQIPLEQRQAQITAAQGRPTSYYGSTLNTPQGPVRPPQMQRPQSAPQQRTGGPGMGPVRPQQQFAPQQRAPQARPQQQFAPQQRPEPSFFQQALSYAKPVSAGISALGSLFSLF